MTMVIAHPRPHWLALVSSAIAAGLMLFCAGQAAAQSQGCTTSRLANPPGEVLTCGNGLTITAEAAASFRLQGENRANGPTGAILNRRAVLVETPNGTVHPFQIRTPHAIASVRGTIWAIDVGGGRTSVFVQRGAVSVARGGGGRGVVLTPGEGVDVADTGPLTVRRWPQERVRNLLARLGR
jgi:ferric-dicitrate binding protein FerR (iron transport regulator)